MIDGQALVNAQVEVNRAVFLMNVRGNEKFYPGMSDEDITDEKILFHIREAEKCLSRAKAYQGG